jgi:hypothetical protein
MHTFKMRIKHPIKQPINDQLPTATSGKQTSPTSGDFFDEKKKKKKKKDRSGHWGWLQSTPTAREREIRP